MIVDIALARDGFIETEDTLYAPTETGVLASLKPFLKFTQKDLQNFDGVSFQMINSFDPTNSIFIYKNDTGKFLYQIQNATPQIHKNNLIWNCGCVMLDTEENLTFTENNKVIIEKNIFPEVLQSYTDKIYKGYNVVVKDNFKTMSTRSLAFGFGADWDEETSLEVQTGYCILKIKCTTNPTTQTLNSNALDGSYNFIFPVYFEGNDVSPNFTVLNTSIATSLDEAISKYLPNIKTIELLPFKCFDDKFSVPDTTRPTQYEVNGIATDLGIFVSTPSIKVPFAVEFSKLIPNTKQIKQILMGGGARGFVQTPAGNVQLDFNTGNSKYPTSILPDTAFYVQVKEDGWKIDGLAKADIPPTYLNFYTDNAGQVFIQNLTTGAMELRNINRDASSEWKQMAIDYNAKQTQAGFSTLSSVGGNFGGLNWLGAITTLGTSSATFKANEAQAYYDIEKHQLKYAVAKEKYEDKQLTESLLASLTGKQLAGQFNFSDAEIVYNSKYFNIVLEMNFKIVSTYTYTTTTPVEKIETPNYVICQKDYDYSINTQGENILTINGNSFSDAIRKMLGYDDIEGDFSETGILALKNNYLDLSGLNYNIVFKIYSTANGRNDFSQTIILPIRNSLKIS